MADQHRATPTKTPSAPDQKSRSASHPLPGIPHSQHQASAGSTDAPDDDLVYHLTRRELNNYQSLDRGPPPYPWQERGPGPQAMPAPIAPAPRSSYPPSSQTSTSAATSPPRDPRAMPLDSDNNRPHPRPQLQQPVSPNPRLADGEDEIVELHSKAKDALRPENKGREQTGKPGAGEGEDEVQDIPNTNFAIACMVTLCFNLPLGILAMYFSLKAVQAFQDGRTKLGEKRSRWSIFISLLGIAFTTVLVSSIVFYIAMQGQKRISQYKAYSIKSGLSL